MPSPEEKETISALLRPLRSPCVLELGAHTGEEESWIRQCFTEPCHYVMVEPDPRNCQQILNRPKGLSLKTHDGTFSINFGDLGTYWYTPVGSRRLIIGAVAETEALRQFHFSQNRDNGSRTSGSLRKPTGHLKFFPEIEFNYTGMVPVYSLDFIFEREYLTKIDLLWADIQGAENLMIQGGQNALKHTRYLFMEKEHTELYEGEALRDGLVAMLPGWSLVREFEYNILLRNDSFEERGPR